MFEKQLSRPSRPLATQRRGVERVAAILQAAEELLDEQGYEAATLKAIGERAGVPTASLYHYFADRGEVEAELGKRHADRLHARIEAAVGASRPCSIAETVDAILDPLLEYFREHPSLVQLWFAGRGPALGELAEAFDQTWAQRLWHLLVEQELIAADTPVDVVSLAFAAADRLFDLAFLRSKNGDSAIIAEARRLVAAYLATYAPPQGLP